MSFKERRKQFRFPVNRPVEFLVEPYNYKGKPPAEYQGLRERCRMEAIRLIRPEVPVDINLIH